MTAEIAHVGLVLMGNNVHLLLVVSLVFGGTIWDFERRTSSSVTDFALPAQAVVFTGQFDRVRLALDLMERGEIERVFITGVNAGAGILEGRFVTQFSLEGDLLQAFVDGKIVLGTLATTTLQNATETKCWVERTGQFGPILLITSKRHMPRASVALEQALPGHKIWRMSLPYTGQSDGNARSIQEEYLKYLATFVITYMPTGIGKVLSENLGQPPPIDCE